MIRTYCLAIFCVGAVTTASAADLGEPAPAAIPSVVDYAFTWTGPYVGLSAGYSFGNADWDNDSVPFIDSSSDLDGFVGGAFIGYNYQFDSLVVGAEADLFFGGIDGRADCIGGDVPDFGCSTDVDFFGTIRARVGYAFDQLFVYGTGGLAYARFEHERSAAGGPLLSFERDDDQFGFAVGAGVEYAASDNLFIRGEYQYLNFGSSDVTLSNGVGTSPASIESDMHQLRLGLGYRF